jgi:hypothetical protein
MEVHPRFELVDPAVDRADTANRLVEICLAWDAITAERRVSASAVAWPKPTRSRMPV